MNRFSLIVFAFLFSSHLFAQTSSPVSDKTVQNQQNWFTYFAQYKLSEKWGVHTDVQFRMDENVQFAKQNLVRAGLIRYFTPKLNFTTGYAYINSHNAGLNDYATEHRIWEQLIYAHRPAELGMTHRFRLEQRFVEKLSRDKDGSIASEYVYGNRFRYFNRTIVDLTKNPEAQNVFYIAFQDEVFLNFASPDINKNFFDQNRFLLAFGVFHAKKTRLELGYMNQFSNPQNGPNVMNHIGHVSILQTLNFMKPVKAPVAN